MCVAGERDTIGPPYPQVSHLIQWRIKNFWKETPGSSKKWNSNLPHVKHYANATNMKQCVGTPCCSLCSNVGYIYVNIGYVQIMVHFIQGTWASMGFGIGGVGVRGPGTNSLRIPRNNCIFYILHFCSLSYILSLSNPIPTIVPDASLSESPLESMQLHVGGSLSRSEGHPKR